MIYTKNIQQNMLTLAPDALVFINGKDTISSCGSCNCGLRLREVISTISVDLSVNSAPGSASITVANPQHVITPLLNKSHEAFSTMQEVEIYMKGQFIKDGVPAYYPVFWGFITGVSENYSDGTYNISLSCKDILRWWEISKVNVRPTGVDSQFVSLFNPTIFSKTYSNMKVPEIIRDLANITVRQLMPVNNLYFNQISDKVEDLAISNLQLLEYWERRFSQIGRALRIFGFNGEEITDENMKSVKKANSQEHLNENITGTQDTETPVENHQTSDSSTIAKLGYSGPDIREILPDILHVNGVSIFDSEYESKLETANSIKEVIKYEFYMDFNGEVIFKPPYYNMDVRENPVNVIDDIDIIDWGFTEDEGAAVTRVDVSGAQTKYDQTETKVNPVYGVYLDYFHSLKYGLRVQTFQVPYLRNPVECEVYAQSEVSRLNALLKTGSMTIMGRPELRLGYPIYCRARDAFYYVTGISHNFTFGGSFTTSLTLTAERKKIRDERGSVRKWLAIVLDDPDRTVEDNALLKAKSYRKLDPTITDDKLKDRLKKSFPKLEDVKIDSILNLSREPITQNTSTAMNPAFRKSIACMQNQPIEKERLKTVNDVSSSGNQGKKPRLVDGFKLQVNNLKEIREKGLQITDGEGYQLIGAFGYGRYNTYDPNSRVVSRNLEDFDNFELFNQLRSKVFMSPEYQEVDRELSKDNFQMTLNDKNQMMATFASDLNVPHIIEQMRVTTEYDVCNCDCHENRSQ